MLYQHLVTGCSGFFLSFPYVLCISHGILKHMCLVVFVYVKGREKCLVIC